MRIEIVVVEIDSTPSAALGHFRDERANATLSVIEIWLVSIPRPDSSGSSLARMSSWSSDSVRPLGRTTSTEKLPSRLTVGGTASSAAASPASTEIVGGMQNLSASIHQSWKTNRTIGRNRLSRKSATIMISGIAKKQIAAILGDRFSSGILVWSGSNCCGCAKAVEENRPGGAVAIWALSTAKSGIRIVTGRLDVPYGSIGAASA